MAYGLRGLYDKEAEKLEKLIVLDIGDKIRVNGDQTNKNLDEYFSNIGKNSDSELSVWSGTDEMCVYLVRKYTDSVREIESYDDSQLYSMYRQILGHIKLCTYLFKKIKGCDTRPEHYPYEVYKSIKIIEEFEVKRREIDNNNKQIYECRSDLF